MVHAVDKYAQTDLPLPEISEPMALLDGQEVTEYTLNDAGQWESSQACIPRRWNDGHFKTITLVKVRIQEQDYAGLIFCFTTGAYRYPEVGRDWYSFDYNYLYVFKQNELNKFLYSGAITNKPKLVTLNVLYKTGATEISSLPQNLQQGILEPKLKYGVKDLKNIKLVFNLLPSVVQGNIRFTMVESSLKKYNFSPRLKRITHANFNSNLILDRKIISPGAFKQNYYEVDYKLFNQVFDLKKDN
jgi:hypothetical protein